MKSSEFGFWAAVIMGGATLVILLQHLAGTSTILSALPKPRAAVLPPSGSTVGGYPAGGDVRRPASWYMLAWPLPGPALGEIPIGGVNAGPPAVR